MNRSLYAALSLTLLAVSLPARAEERSRPSPTTTARMSGVTPRGARQSARKWEGASVPTRRHGSDVPTRDDARKPAAARVPVRRP